MDETVGIDGEQADRQDGIGECNDGPCAADAVPLHLEFTHHFVEGVLYGRSAPYIFGCKNGQGEVSAPGSTGTSISTGPECANAFSSVVFRSNSRFS